MGLGDLTLLLVGRDAFAEQLHVHLEHRGADIERADADEALDTIRVAIPDLVLISQDASTSHGERIRDGLSAAGGKPPRTLVLCERKLAAKIVTYKHDFLSTLEPELGSELIASCIESLCTLMSTPSSASKPLRALVADVRRSHVPTKPIAAAKQTLAGTAPLIAPAPAAPAPVAPALAAPPPAATVAPQLVVPPPAAAVAPPIELPKSIVSAAPPRQPTPLAALLQAPPTKPVVVVSVPAPKPAPIPAPIVEVAKEPELELEISVASLPPAAPAPVPVATPSPTPLFVETQTATPAPPAPAEPSRLHALRAKALRTTPRQRAIAAGVIALCAAAVVALSMGGDDAEPIASHASASLSNAAQQAKALTVPAAPVLAAAPAPAPVAPPAPVVAPSAEATHVAEAATAEEEPIDSMVDGELYDPGADPARAKANYLVNTGHRLRKQGRWGMAEASYLKALEAMPHYARAVTGLVAVHLGRRDGVEALRWAKKLVELQPKRGVHHRMLGDAHALAGNTRAAQVAWQTAVRLGDRDARTRLQ